MTHSTTYVGQRFSPAICRVGGLSLTTRRGAFVVPALLVWAALVAGCGPKRLALPTAAGTPLPDASPILTEALGHCAALRTITLEIGLSGRAAGQRLRVRLIAGLAEPDGIRLEAVAPIGAPVFILASAAGHSQLLLPRDDRIMADVAPADILEALAGIHVSPGELLRLLAGCPRHGSEPRTARAVGRDWVVADASGGDVAYFRRIGNRWRLAAVRGAALDAEFAEGTGPQPGRVRLSRPSGGTGAPFDLALRLSQVETNVDVPARAFTVRVPAGAEPITLEELRRSGPLRDRSSS